MAYKSKKKKAAQPKKNAPRKSASTKPSRNTPVDVGESFEIVEGIPKRRTKATPEEEQRIMNTLSQLKINKNHGVVPSKLKSATKRLAEKHYPQRQLSVSYNRAKHTISVWWSK